MAARPNRPATGAPIIGGTARVGETLATDVLGIADEDGLENATFSYQWISNDGTTDADIQGETGATYTLTDANEGKTIKVKVTFTMTRQRGDADQPGDCRSGRWSAHRSASRNLAT